jgi:predicted glycoside hydrolase/deacetylase ChbG (UPF0249 family)
MTASSLAQRLGFGPEDRLLIVNCDDLGVSHAADVATWRALAYGVATSATLMVPCPWAREAARMLRGFPIGIHLTLTSEYPGYRWRGLTGGASLHDTDGFLHPTMKAALARVDAGEAWAECRAQIETALRWGVDVTHLDAHMNVPFGRSDLLDVYLDLAQEFRLPVRMHPSNGPGATDLPGRERAAAQGVLCNDHLIYPWPRRTRDVFFGSVSGLPPGVSEIFAHPVLDGEELRGYDTTHADIRVRDTACLLDPSVSALLGKHGVRRISYREVRDVQREG